MRATQPTPSHQLVRSTPNDVVMSTNMPSHLVTSTTTPSQQGMRSNVIPSQDMMSSQYPVRSRSRPSSSSQLPRNVSIKNNRDGTKEVVVETSVSVAFTFQQEGYHGQDGGEQDGHLPLDDGAAPGHQLVCCSCVVSMPSLQVGECGCLVCRLCMEMMDRPGYCKNCKISVRYTELERIIRFPDKGKLGKLFMSPCERENLSTKEFLKKVLKEEKDFKIVDRVLTKQEAAFARRNSLHSEELEKIVKEEEELQRKIQAKTQAIRELEESIRSRSEQQYQYQQISRPMLQYQPRLQIQQELKQQMVIQDDIHHGAKPDYEQEKLKVFDMNYDETDDTEFQQTMHERALMKDQMQQKGEEFEEKTVYKARPEQMRHQVKQMLDKKMKREESTKEGTYSAWNSAIKEICKAGSSSMGVVPSPVAGLKSILKKKIPSRGFLQEDAHATSPWCGEVKIKEVMKEKSVEKVEKVSQDKTGSLVPRDIIRSSFGDCRQSDMKGGRTEEGEGRSITQVPGDWRREENTPINKRGRLEDAQGGYIPQVCGDWRKMDTPSKKRGRMEETRYQDSGHVVERKLDDNMMKRQVACVGKVTESGTECKVPNDSHEKDEKMSVKTLHRSSKRNVMNDQKPAPVSASEWMTRAVKGGAGIAGRAGTGRKDQQAVGRERKALPPLSSVRHPDRRTGEAVEAVTEQASGSSERKDKHNMTYDYLDMIVNRGGHAGGERAGAQPRPSGSSGVRGGDPYGVQGLARSGGDPYGAQGLARSGGDPYGVQGLARSGGVAGRNSQLFWDQYLL